MVLLFSHHGQCLVYQHFGIAKEAGARFSEEGELHASEQ